MKFLSSNPIYLTDQNSYTPRLLSFPTRRSSDLLQAAGPGRARSPPSESPARAGGPAHAHRRAARPRDQRWLRLARRHRARRSARPARRVGRSPGVAGATGAAGKLEEAMNEPLAVGSKAPPFTAQASDGKTYSLAEVLKQRHVALVFYPGNNTPG